MTNLNTISISRALFACVCIVILTITFSIFINAGLLLIHNNISGYSIVIAHIITLLLIVYNKDFRLSEKLFGTLLFYLLIFISFNFSVNTYDVSWDGQWYHQDAIIKIYNSWNPMHSTRISNYEVIDSEMWIQHYPQASWYLQASILDITDKIQSAKQINLILMFSVLFLGYYTLTQIIDFVSKIVALLCSICLALNPVACYQLNSFYVDGQSAMLLTIYLLLLVQLYKHKSLLLYILLAGVFIYGCNIKFTNLVYIPIFTLSFYLLDLYKSRKINYRISIYFSFIYIITIFYVGYGSYGRNIIENGHPFYPLMGKNNFANVVADVNKSANFINNNRFENFVLSNFSYPKYSRKPNNSEFRIPFTKTEYFQYSRTDSEIAGFGAIYSDILIILILITFLPLTYYIKNYRKYYQTLLLLLTIIISTIINSEMFVAICNNFYKISFLLPIIVLILTYNYKFKSLKIMSVIIFIALIINSYFILERQYKHQIEVKSVIDQEIQYLKTLKQPIQLRNRYLSLERRLLENNISYINNRNNPSVNRKEFVYTDYENYYFDK